jgi:hypothetical protein
MWEKVLELDPGSDLARMVETHIYDIMGMADQESSGNETGQ